MQFEDACRARDTEIELYTRQTFFLFFIFIFYFFISPGGNPPPRLAWPTRKTPQELALVGDVPGKTLENLFAPLLTN